MKLLLLFILLSFSTFVLSQEDFVEVKLSEPIDFNVPETGSSKFYVNIPENVYKQLVIKIMDSNPPQCIEDEGNVRINSTTVKDSISTTPQWSSSTTSCLAITQQTTTSIFVNGTYYISYESNKHRTGLIIFVQAQ